MSEEHQSSSVHLGIFGRASGRGAMSSADIIAIVLSMVWLLAAAVFFAVARMGGADLQFDPLTFLMTFLAVAMPIALIWIGTTTVKSARIVREESARLQATVDAMRQAYIQQQQAANMGVRPSVEKKLDELAQAQKQTETRMATFASSRSGPQAAPLAAAPASAPAHRDDPQPSLALGTPAEALRPPLSNTDFIRALNFPENAEDRAGFDALRRALQDRTAAKLVRAAQDILTLLSQEGIYMDDLNPDRARPEIWRKFAGGERGPSIAAIGGIRDRSSLALAAGRMRQDPVFRDTVHHFLRLFDHTLSGFEETASDQELNDLADTRTARAFMLLGRVTGIF
ncbi:hypothetical protein [Actibacterium ureilyticum]|uniref:hypothetical protein n=1 Tax=Actibacterium ureilyticum TaxID=1590614 RepID=UPI000BAAA4C4|nr:hypothetical protein [Actibacterium ureilyticum]